MPVPKTSSLKTFWPEWRDEQRPDGTIVWTSPAGRTHVTHPGSRLLFPALCLPTGELHGLPTDYRSLSGDRGPMMPTRRRTRQRDRAHRIDAERALNADHVAERNRPPPFYGCRIFRRGGLPGETIHEWCRAIPS